MASTPADEVLRNFAYFSNSQKSSFADFFAALLARQTPDTILLVAADEKALQAAKRRIKKGASQIRFEGKTFADLGFLRVPLSFRDVAEQTKAWLAKLADTSSTVLAVDMSWGLETTSATANFENWMGVAEELTTGQNICVASLYNRRILIDEQLLAALRGHPQILTPTSLVKNPHWLPIKLMQSGTLREQVDFWLGEVSADLAQTSSSTQFHAAEGADPMWLLRRSAEEAPSSYLDRRERWKIRCFGRLRIYRNDGSQVNWDQPGGATRKTKTLFAFLLQKGGQGADADELSDLLWPDAESSEAATNRLYHTVRFLRLSLRPPGGRSKDANFILRDGSRYVLVPPQRSWLDISTFEQLCRQSQTHIKAGASDEALICLQAADRLYTGDLFEDIPAEYADNSERDWCWSKRYWLRDMFFKVQRDAARIYRERKDFSAALAHCQKALSIDPLCEIAHAEAMRVFKEQGRAEAIDRQYKLYLNSLNRFDDRPQSTALRDLYKSLN